MVCEEATVGDMLHAVQQEWWENNVSALPGVATLGQLPKGADFGFYGSGCNVFKNRHFF